MDKVILSYSPLIIVKSNLIIYGPKGAGKKTLINILLKDIYGYIPKLQ